ncbi:MAG: YceD family protein [Steroidobacter sp.]
MQLSDAIVDADVCARAGTSIERRFSAADLPRLGEAGIGAGSTVDASFQFSQFDKHPAVDGALNGSIVTTCQRCMKAVTIQLKEQFQVVVLGEERGDEPGGYEPLVADASRLDLRWLTEEQVLLALPLVPTHESEDCINAQASSEADDDESVRQKPFQNLRDMLRQR